MKVEDIQKAGYEVFSGMVAEHTPKGDNPYHVLGTIKEVEGGVSVITPPIYVPSSDESKVVNAIVKKTLSKINGEGIKLVQDGECNLVIETDDVKTIKYASKIFDMFEENNLAYGMKDRVEAALIHDIKEIEDGAGIVIKDILFEAKNQK